MQMELEIVTPSGRLAKESVDELVVPGYWGQLDILPQHTDFITTLTAGALTYRLGPAKQSHNISGGLLTITGNKATVLADGLMATVTPLDPEKRKKKEIL